MVSEANTRLERPLVMEFVVVLVAFNTKVPPVTVMAPAKLGLTVGTTEAPLAMPPTVRVFPVVLDNVTVVALLIALIYQFPVRAALVTCCPTTRLAVLATVKMGAVVVPVLSAVVVSAAVEPLTVPRATVVPVLVAA